MLEDDTKLTKRGDTHTYNIAIDGPAGAGKSTIANYILYKNLDVLSYTSLLPITTTDTRLSLQSAGQLAAEVSKIGRAHV